MRLEQINEKRIQEQAAAAGFSTATLYVQCLLERDAERLAVQEGVDSLKAGRHRPFDEFDKEFRERNGLSPRS